MSRWTTAFASIAIIAFSLPAIAADDDLPRNIELKPGAAASDAADKTAEDTGTTTRQIVTEGKDAPAAEAPKEGAASEPAPAAPAPAAPAEAAPALAKAETAPPPEPAPEAPKPPAEAAVPAPPPPPPPGLKPEEVVFAVQTELKRVGCDPGAIDGDWGGRSREALAAFGHFAKVDVGKLAPTPEVLELIKGKVRSSASARPRRQSNTPLHLRTTTMAAAVMAPAVTAGVVAAIKPRPVIAGLDPAIHSTDAFTG